MIPLVYKGILLKNAMGLNRTFMELKPVKNDKNRYRLFGLNRTFMELKQNNIVVSLVIVVAS